MRLAIPLATIAVLAALLCSCGGSTSSSDESSGSTAGPRSAPAAPIGATARACGGGGAQVAGLRVSGASCAEARQVMRGWLRAPACSPRAGASRASCDSGPYRCLSARTDRGFVVGCSQAGRSVAFLLRHG